MLPKRNKYLINLAVFLAASAAISYEILGASILVTLLGSSIYYFSLTIGIFLAALGVGSWLSSKIEQNIAEKMIFIETILAFLGGGLAVLIYGSYIMFFGLLKNATFNSVFGFLLGLSSAQLAFSFLAFFLIFIVGVLIGFELPLFSRIFARDAALKDALGKVFFWDYAGSLAASVLLPVVFFIAFGIIKTSFLMGMINVLAALALVLVLFSEKITVKPILFLALIMAFLANLSGFIFGNRIELFFEKKQYGDREILYHKSSPYQRFSFVKADDGKISLYINGQRQFESGEWDALYHETFVHPAMSLVKNRKGILVLGGGDGLALREILKYNDVSHVTLVDVDAAIIKAASKLDFMRNLNRDSFSDARVKVVIDDAFKFVGKNQDSEIYDLIFVDFPDPTDDTLAKLYSKEFYLMLKNILSSEGIAVVQSGGYLDSNQRTIMRTLKSAGFEILAIHPPKIDILDKNFGFTLASKNKISKSVLEELSATVPTVVFQGNSLGRVLDPAPVPSRIKNVGINTIFRPVITKAAGSIFAVHYFESRPTEDILKQIKLPPEEIYNQFYKLAYTSFSDQ